MQFIATELVMVIVFCVAGSQDTDDYLHTKRDLWPRTHHQTLPVLIVSILHPLLL